MVCNHLKELYSLCETLDLRLGGSDLIRIVCRQCGEEETCPSMLMAEYDSRHPDVALQTNSAVAASSETPAKRPQ